jgi:hypothetical protein
MDSAVRHDTHSRVPRRVRLAVDWRTDLKAKTTSVSDAASLLYVFFRNWMIHGYRGRAVFLTADETSSFKLEEPEGTMALNPGWLWKRYEEVVASNFDYIVNSSLTPNPKRADGPREERKWYG